MAIAAAGCVVLATASATIAGRVTDSEGAAITKAHVLLHPDHSGEVPPIARPDVISSTDDEGLFTVAAAPGFYDFCVMADAFTPQCSKLFVKDAETVRRNVQLKADALVARQLGDTFKRQFRLKAEATAPGVPPEGGIYRPYRNQPPEPNLQPPIAR